jgi:hypothetical protein
MLDKWCETRLNSSSHHWKHKCEIAVQMQCNVGEYRNKMESVFNYMVNNDNIICIYYYIYLWFIQWTVSNSDYTASCGFNFLANNNNDDMFYISQ